MNKPTTRTCNLCGGVVDADDKHLSWHPETGYEHIRATDCNKVLFEDKQNLLDLLVRIVQHPETNLDSHLFEEAEKATRNYKP